MAAPWKPRVAEEGVGLGGQAGGEVAVEGGVADVVHHHHRDAGPDQVAERAHVGEAEGVERRGDGHRLLEVDVLGGPALAGEVLDRRPHPAVGHPFGEGEGVLGGDGGVGGERAVADDLVVGPVGEVGHRRQVEVDAEAGQDDGHLVGVGPHVGRRPLVGHAPGRRARPEDVAQARHPSRLLVDGDDDGPPGLGPDALDQAHELGLRHDVARVEEDPAHADVEDRLHDGVGRVGDVGDAHDEGAGRPLGEGDGRAVGDRWPGRRWRATGPGRSGGAGRRGVADPAAGGGAGGGVRPRARAGGGDGGRRAGQGGPGGHGAEP